MAEVKRDKNDIQIDELQKIDKDIIRKVAYSRACTMYELQIEADGPKWAKSQYEGTCYWVERKTEPTKQFWVKSVTDTSGALDFKDTPGIDWEIECKTNYVFYKKTADTSAPVRALWFPDDSDRQKWQDMIENDVMTLREAAGYVVEAKAEGGGASDTAQQLKAMGTKPGDEAPFTVGKEELKAALHGLADNKDFIDAIIQKLKA